MEAEEYPGQFRKWKYRQEHFGISVLESPPPGRSARWIGLFRSGRRFATQQRFAALLDQPQHLS